MSAACAVIVFLLGFAGCYYNQIEERGLAQIANGLWWGVRWVAIAYAMLGVLSLIGCNGGPVVL